MASGGSGYTRYVVIRNEIREEAMKIKASVVLSVAATAAVVSAAVAGVFTGAYGAGTMNQAPAPTVSVQTAANPVDILQKMHVLLSPGKVSGQADLEGDRYAIASFPDGEQVAVYTFADAAAQSADIERNGASNDAHRLLVGHLFDVWVTGVDTGNGIGFPEPPAVLAHESGAAVRQL